MKHEWMVRVVTPVTDTTAELLSEKIPETVGLGLRSEAVVERIFCAKCDLDYAVGKETKCRGYGIGFPLMRTPQGLL